jgi:hypothetical protein
MSVMLLFPTCCDGLGVGLVQPTEVLVVAGVTSCLHSAFKQGSRCQVYKVTVVLQWLRKYQPAAVVVVGCVIVMELGGWRGTVLLSRIRHTHTCYITWGAQLVTECHVAPTQKVQLL